MKDRQRARRGRNGIVVGILGLLGTLAWLRGSSLAQQTTPVFPPEGSLPAAPAPSPAEPPLAGTGSAPPPSPRAPAPSPGPLPLQGSPSPTPPMPPGPYAPPYSSLPGLVPMVPAVGSPGREPADPPAPQVTIRVRVPARVAPGDNLTYRLVVENRSQARAHHVVVRDRLSPGAEMVRANPEPAEKTPDLLWKLGTLEPCSRKEITLVVKPAGKAEVENHAYVQSEHGQTVRTQVSRPGLRLRVSAPASAQLVLPIDLQLEVTNDGQVEAHDVVLTSELPKDLDLVNAASAEENKNLLTWKLGKLRPGETKSQLLQVMTKQPGDYKLRSEVVAAGDLREIAHTTLKVGEGKLALSIAGPASSCVNQQTTYQLTVTNTGTVPSPGVEIVDRLYAGIHFQGASDDGQLNGQEVRWRLGALAPGASRTVSCTVLAQGEGLFANVVRARDDMGLSALARTSTRFSWLTVSMERRQDPLQVGQQATLVFHLANSGMRPASQVRLSVIVPESLRVVPLADSHAGQVEGGRMTFRPVAQLMPGQSLPFSLQVQAVKAGKAVVRAEMVTQEMADCKDGRFREPLVCEETIQIVEGPQDPSRVTFNQP